MDNNHQQTNYYKIDGILIWKLRWKHQSSLVVQFLWWNCTMLLFLTNWTSFW